MARPPEIAAPIADPERARAPLTAAAARDNLIQLVQLRWMAVVGQVATIVAVEWGLGVRLPLAAMAGVVAVLVVGNLFSLVRLSRPAPVSSGELFLSLVFDALVLTVLLALSGGPTNPFTSLYLLQVILGAMLLDVWGAWSMVAVTAVCFLALTILHLPLRVPTFGPDLFTLYIAGMAVGFALNAFLLVIFIIRINSTLRLRDARLADLRQQAAEEDHIVRMGLLASGAAHELGTPLSTMDVILGDWRRMPKLTKDPELAQDIEDMRSELARCKSIVTGVLVSAGDPRGEHAGVSSLKAYLSELFEEWRDRRAADEAAYADALKQDRLIVADSALKQALHNLLDNAFDACRDGVRMRAAADDGQLVVTVEDHGPGFSPAMLADFGRPYQSTKGKLGGGLGLFLVVNVVRKLGGRIQARNRPSGGAEVTLFLPLEALAIEAAP
jgi:two-component system sensor histidine kinase RegB